MKIAVLADVHANLPALKEVLKDINRQKIDEVWYLGDFLGYGPFPEKVVELLKKHTDQSIAGNYDLNVLKYSKVRNKWRKKKDPSKLFLYNWTFKNISQKVKKYIKSLPVSISLERKGIKFLLVHGSPEKIDEPLKVDTPRKRFEQLAKEIDEQVVLCGHTHSYFDKKIGRIRYLNPGSVGRPFDHDTRASYGIITVDNGQLKTENRRIQYGLNNMLKKMKKEKFPADVIDSIKFAKSLDEVKEEYFEKVSDKEIIDQVIKLARSCDYEKGHSHQVTKIALKLFDELKSLHQLSDRHRILLQSASLLHDIGWVKGRIRHHKRARDIILKSFNLPLNREEKTIVALTARYHRKSLPLNTHKYYSDLNAEKKEELKKLASLLRFADGLDRGHVNAIKDITCKILPKKIIFSIVSDQFSDWEKEVAYKKSDLLCDVFKRRLEFKRK